MLSIPLTWDTQCKISRLRQDRPAFSNLRSRLPPRIIQPNRHRRHARHVPDPVPPRHLHHHQAVYVVQAECAARRRARRRRQHHLQHDAAHPHAGALQASHQDVQGGARKVQDKPARAGGCGWAEVGRGGGAGAEEGEEGGRLS